MDKIFERSCPVCNKPMTYKERWLRNRAERQGSKCRACHIKSVTISPEGKEKQARTWFKKGDRPLNADFRKGKNLKEIYGDKAEDIRIKYSNRIRSEESNIKRSKSCKKAGCGLYNKGRKCTEKNKKLYRIQMIDRLKKTYKNFHPGYNTKACKIFDELMKQFKIEIQHALNGGEYHIEKLGYYVDGYDSLNNVIYEYDERRHYDVYGKLNEKDVKKQKDIEHYLNCKFIRIKWNEPINEKLYDKIQKIYNI